MDVPNNFDIPGVYYFESGNIFSGSSGDLNFRIVPDKERMTVTVWHGFICSELAEPEAQAGFPISKEGEADMAAWLEQQRDGAKVGLPE